MDQGRASLLSTSPGVTAGLAPGWAGISLAQAADAGHVAVHLIVGLGETEREMTEMIRRMHDLGVVVGLFAFTPVRGTAMQDQPPPPLDTYRRMQVARHLISHDLATLGDFSFSAEGRLVSFGRPDLAKILADGVAFQTSGCPDCNRPFYNERPGGPLYNYPRLLTPEEALRAISETRTSRRDGRHEFGSK